MAALPPIRKLYIEDYASQKSWIGPFLLLMNTFMTTVVSALTKGLTLTDNTTSGIKTVILTYPPTSSNPISVLWDKQSTPIAVVVGNVRLINGNVILSNAIEIQWQMDSGSLQITNVVGITPSDTQKYILTLVCIAG